MSILALTILAHVPDRDRLRVLREVKVQLEAYGEDDAVADCKDLIRHVEALRPREAVRAERQITEEDGA